jgi:hypothetical protein
MTTFSLTTVPLPLSIELSGTPVAGQHISMGGTYSWLAHSDAIDSTTMVTDQTGAVVWDRAGGADFDF